MSPSQRPPASPSPISPSAVTSAADLLSYIPHALGFLPDESLVVITLADRRLGATLRVDLPPEGSDPLVFAEGILSFLGGDLEADGTLMVVYTKQDWKRLTVPPRNTLVLDVQAVLEAAGLRVRGGWLVSPSGWRDYFCIDEGCCAWPGQPLDSVSYSPLSAELVYGGSAFDASAAAAVQRDSPALGILGGTHGTVLRSVEDAQAEFATRCADRWTHPAQFRAAAAVWDAVIGQMDELDPAQEPELVGFLLATVESRTVRDFLLASACLGSERALQGARACGLLEPAHPTDPAAEPAEATPAGTRSADPRPGCTVSPSWGRNVVDVVVPDVRSPGTLQRRVRAARKLTPVPVVGPGSTTGVAPVDLISEARSLPEPSDQGPLGDAALDYADLLAGRRTGPIDWSRVDAMSGVLARLISVSDGEARAAALTMSGWFEYARGRGSRAAVYLDAAERAAPGYRLARLLQELLRRGGLPAWARRRSTAWAASAALPPSGAT